MGLHQELASTRQWMGRTTIDIERGAAGLKATRCTINIEAITNNLLCTRRVMQRPARNEALILVYTYNYNYL